MKILSILSIAAWTAVTVAQTTQIATDSTLNINPDPATFLQSLTSPVSFSDNDETVEPPNDMADPSNEDEIIDASNFIAWSSPGYKGHKQKRSNSEGCYRLDGGAVGSFEGSSSRKYGFYSDGHCRSRMIYGWSSAPVHRIDPLIYPQSVKIIRRDEPKPSTCPAPSDYTLVAWSRTSFGGRRQLIRGLGCRPLDGSTIYSFQGTYKYKFYDCENCYGDTVLETSGGKSRVHRMNPRSVFIY
ncbi:hypothetical protein BX616_003299 [Lobosporangium transversale]|uniref:Uncharacterized protein n=1 Tax=Lobosporangium transversale TaxID=64571 RepID=A0A1Y2GJH1_9FUNG|nr:hypothetical protein BCR41DRAFT_407871 [Lobosporangium transversale]KAF9916622.1 hypothetical protein BX616_003299 [Lobosporangium transversale]ORZ12890.1 hypothetical protein BCR41DRAFT_407871 [Lobosporangium transversale]|eukprot:XP_021880239.1 hypothetical protein BCR41DRAFT_407871 [Lobosporangium transversale]